MKAGLLGAIGGVGKALEGFGSDLQKRREQALEDARELAKEQSRLAARAEERAADRGLRIDLADRASADRVAINERNIAARREDIGTRQAGQEKLVELREGSQRRLKDYGAKLSRQNTVAAQQSAEAIRSGRVVDVITSGDPKKRPDGKMREQIMHVMGDGTVVGTGQWIKPGSSLSPPKSRRADTGGGSSGLLDLDEEDEEEEE